MFGVVLWCDNERNSAVIWCEDHRNLAFVREDPDGAVSRQGFSPGDLVAFDLREEDDIRLAVDPCMVAPQEYPWLATHLKAAAGLRPRTAPPATAPQAGRGADRRVVVLHPDARHRGAGASGAPGAARCG